MLPEFKRNQNGFTLVEVLVTLVIFSFVMVMLFSSFNSFISTGQSIADSVDYNERARDVFTRIAGDLTNVYMPESRIIKVMDSAEDQDLDTFQMTGGETRVDAKTFSTLAFASLSGLRLGRSRPSGVVRLTYYVRQNRQGLFDLCRAERPIGSDEDTDSCSDPVLAANIAGFTINFIDGQSDEYQQWDGDKDKEQGALPSALNIVLTLKSGQKEKIYETAVILPVQGQDDE